jgi:hypothetical protein
VSSAIRDIKSVVYLESIFELIFEVAVKSIYQSDHDSDHAIYHRIICSMFPEVEMGLVVCF